VAQLHFPQKQHSCVPPQPEQAQGEDSVKCTTQPMKQAFFSNSSGALGAPAISYNTQKETTAPAIALATQVWYCEVAQENTKWS